MTVLSHKEISINVDIFVQFPFLYQGEKILCFIFCCLSADRNVFCCKNMIIDIVEPFLSVDFIARFTIISKITS